MPEEDYTGEIPMTTPASNDASHKGERPAADKSFLKKYAMLLSILGTLAFVLLCIFAYALFSGSNEMDARMSIPHTARPAFAEKRMPPPGQFPSARQEEGGLPQAVASEISRQAPHGAASRPEGLPSARDWKEMKEAAASLRADVAELKKIIQNLPQAAAPAPTPSSRNTAASQEQIGTLSKTIGDMTKELQRMEVKNKQLAQALAATERKVDELTQENARLKKGAAAAKSGEDRKNDDKKSVAKEQSGPSVAKWKLLGLSSNKVVLEDANGRIHSLGAGETLHGVKIQAIDLESGNIRTSAGNLKYGG